MVEASGEYVLQWEGHAGHVTERFSCLLARQALVDVTLICEEQKLHVHKLVLASCSLYFEEILEQDLGQEPVILLSDLNFHVLKAMVEFMYCGETTISQQYLEPLLHAAKIFKVKELACIAGNMMGLQNAIEDQSRSSMALDEDTDEPGSGNHCLLYDDSESVSTTGCEELVDNKCSTAEINGNSDIGSEDDQSLQSNMPNCRMDNELEPTLYEESCDTGKSETDWVRNTQTPGSISFCTSQRECLNIELSPPVLEDMSKVVFQNRRAYSQKSRSNEDMSNDFSAKYEGRNKSKPVLFEQRCDILSNETYAKDSLPCSQREADNSSRFSSDFQEVPGKIGKCLKVYSHKRRRSAKRTRNRLMKLARLLPEPQTDSCIDLSDESETPVTLPTSLEMESTEYILSLSTESIESTVGCTANEAEAVISGKERMARANVDANSIEVYPVNMHKEGKGQMEKIPDHNGIIAAKRPETLTCQSDPLSRPMLRRSIRLSQQESDDSANNNDLEQDAHAGRDRSADSKKDHAANGSEGATRLKRKTKEPVQCGFDENAVTTPESKCSEAPRSLRSSSKFTARNEEKPHLSLSRSGKAEQRTKTGNKLKLNKLMKPDNAEASAYVPLKFNTIASVSRALWGDMSDFLENQEYAAEFPDYSPSKEIPFAVGLLPLRAALERMQAMPDYQPRKTRSSVTPLKQEFNGVKRKSCSAIADSSGTVKKQNNTGSLDDKTFCHFHITTTQQPVRSRRRLLPEQEATDEQTNVANRR